MITHFIYDPAYECDVSIVCTNLYMDFNVFPREHVHVHRKELIDLLYLHRSELTFHIYGPPDFKEMYPECYRGSIAYSECPKVFANSKINLCIHATSHNNYDDFLYYSERLPQIMGSNGLVYCETEYHTPLVPDHNYVLANPQDPLGQIKEIIRNYQPKYQGIKQRGYDLAIKSLTWDTFRIAVGKVLLPPDPLKK